MVALGFCALCAPLCHTRLALSSLFLARISLLLSRSFYRLYRPLRYAGRCARALLRGVGCALLLHHLWRLGHWQRAAEGRRRRCERLLRHPRRVRAGHWPGRVRDPRLAPPSQRSPLLLHPLPCSSHCTRPRSNFYNGPLTTEDPRWRTDFQDMYNFCKFSGTAQAPALPLALTPSPPSSPRPSSL
jgi:hypothetical protein